MLKYQWIESVKQEMCHSHWSIDTNDSSFCKNVQLTIIYYIFYIFLTAIIIILIIAIFLTTVAEKIIGIWKDPIRRKISMAASCTNS